jgi:CRP-like cAMP-binding protein
VITREFLREVDLFSGLTDDHFAKLAGLAREDTFRKGEPIPRERDLRGRTFVVLSGVVEIVRARGDRPVRLARLERGEWFGDMPYLEDVLSPVAAQAAVCPETHVASFETAALRKLCDEDPALCIALLRSLAVKLARRLRQTSDAVFAMLRLLDGGPASPGA